MYTTESRESILTKVKFERAKAGLEADVHWGNLLDDLDVFSYHSESWLGQFLRIFEPDVREWRDPVLSRIICLNILARQSIYSVKAVSLMLRNGMHLYALSSFRDLYEAWASAEFIRLDESGLASMGWLHHKLSDDDDSTTAELESEWEHWAKTADGRIYADVSERSRYVNSRIRDGVEEWPLNLYTMDDWDSLLRMSDRLYHQANTPTHPGGTPVSKMPSLPEWIIVSTTLASRAILAYRTVVEEHRTETAVYDDEIDEVRQWADMKKSYNSLRVATAEITQPMSLSSSLP